jgi:hypothetical protein
MFTFKLSHFFGWTVQIFANALTLVASQNTRSEWNKEFSASVFSSFCSRHLIPPTPPHSLSCSVFNFPLCSFSGASHTLLCLPTWVRCSVCTFHVPRARPMFFCYVLPGCYIKLSSRNFHLHFSSQLSKVSFHFISFSRSLALLNTLVNIYTICYSIQRLLISRGPPLPPDIPTVRRR